MKAGARDDTIEGLRDRLRGELVTPGDVHYDEARRAWNGMFDRRPRAIVRCATTADVVEALATARAEELEVAVRCGGHSAPGHSTIEGGLLIDVGPMKRVDIDPDRRTARAGAGLRWSELDAATQEHGLAVTGGRVSDTGVTGLTLASGSGWLSRLYGLTPESLVGAEVVLADGSAVRAGEDGDPDLLWALRGGGGNFGVVTELVFRLHPVGPTLLAGMLLYERDRVHEVTHTYRSYIEGAPDEVSGALALLHAPPRDEIPDDLRGAPAVGIIWCYFGPVETGERMLRPLRDALPPVVDAVRPMPYTALQSMLDGSAPRGTHGYVHLNWLPELPDEAIATLVEHTAGTPSPQSMVIVEPLGGAIDRVDRSALALQIPSARWCYHCLSLWPAALPDEPNVSWARELASGMESHGVGEVYPNFLPEDGTQERIAALYGTEKYARLRELKRRYDPDNIFRLNQNITPAS